MKNFALTCIAMASITGTVQASSSNDLNVVGSSLETTSQETRTWNSGLKVGTLGLGLDLSTTIKEDVGLRFNINGLTYSHDEEIDDINYEGDLELMTAGALVDYYPFSSTFRLSAGAYYNNNTFSGTAMPSNGTTIDINDVEYTADEIGQLDAEITFSKFSPYLGLGWGNNAQKEGWSFTFDLGVMYHGEPEAELDAKINDPALEAQIREDVEQEKQSLIDDIQDFKFYPVIMIGMNYKF